MPRTTLVALLATGVLLAGCGDGDDDPRADPTSPSTGSASSEATAPTSSDPTPTVEPATGSLIDHERVRMRVPDGWDKVDPLASFQQMYADPDSFSSVALGDLSAVGDPTLEEQAQNAAELRSRARIEEPVEIAGAEWFHLSGPDTSNTTFDIFGTIHNDSQATIAFSFDKTIPEAEQQELIDSVLATVEWK